MFPRTCNILLCNEGADFSTCLEAVNDGGDYNYLYYKFKQRF